MTQFVGDMHSVINSRIGGLHIFPDVKNMYPMKELECFEYYSVFFKKESRDLFFAMEELYFRENYDELPEFEKRDIIDLVSDTIVLMIFGSPAIFYVSRLLERKEYFPRYLFHSKSDYIASFKEINRLYIEDFRYLYIIQMDNFDINRPNNDQLLSIFGKKTFRRSSIIENFYIFNKLKREKLLSISLIYTSFSELSYRFSKYYNSEDSRIRESLFFRVAKDTIIDGCPWCEGNR